MATRIPTPAQTQPELWQNLINASLDEGHIDGGLTQLQSLLIENVSPSIHHIQMLVYLVLNPIIVNPNAHTMRSSGSSKNEKETESHQYKALQLLYQLLTTVKPSSISRAFPTPSNHTSCVNYEPRGGLQKLIHGAFSKRDDGLWDMVFEAKPESTNGGEDEDESERNVKLDAWDFLQWLVKLWEADPDGTTFLRQLPQGLKMQTSFSIAFGEQYDCSSPLNVVLAASTGTENVAETIKRRSVALSLLKLLHNATITEPEPRFNAAALRQSLHSLLRDLAGTQIQNLEAFLSFFRTLPWIFVADVLSSFLCTPTQTSSGHADGPYAAPSASHFLLEVLPFNPSSPSKKSTSTGNTDRLANNTIKLSLFTLLMSHLSKEEWDAAEPDESWRARITASLEPEGGDDVKRMEVLKRTIELLLLRL